MSKNNASKRIEFVSLRMVREKTSLLYPQRIIRKPDDAAKLFRQFMENWDREVFCIMTLDTKNQPNAFQIISVGTLNASLVHPREVFKVCMLTNAASLMCFHNHPSGDPTPSQEDLIVNDRLCQSGRLLGVELLDHIIIGSDGSFVSLKERGLM
ncbi:JAB domain-containing protein [Paenibacillus sp. HW567]|uniref:JAB domain-containing protein n=1 Tax=Paenibacillus sp. HW567 TaxID=1034769 RepID=UPI000371E1F3|nr:JAB domain-containing protein [Paenibacillus sp. HW567]